MLCHYYFTLPSTSGVSGVFGKHTEQYACVYLESQTSGCPTQLFGVVYIQGAVVALGDDWVECGDAWELAQG